MKRKVYVKQMKILKERAKSHERNHQRKEPETNSLTLSDTNMVEPRKNQETRQSHFTTSSERTAPSASVSNPVVAAGPSIATTWPSTLPAASSSGHTNSGPLPTVDVLMKRSSQRLFQHRQQQQKQQQGHHDLSSQIGDERTNIASNSDTNLHFQTRAFDHEILPPSCLSPAASSYTSNQEDLNNYQQVEKWPKDGSSSEQLSTILPKVIHPSYEMGSSEGVYNAIANANVDQPELHMNENVSSRNDHHQQQPSPPPVFHQLQASRLSEKPPMDAEIPRTVPGYSTTSEHGHDHSPIGQQHQGTNHHSHVQYAIMDSVMHHHHHPNILNHNQHQQLDQDIPANNNNNHHHQHHRHHDHHNHHNSTTTTTNNNNVHDDGFHEQHHGQVRAWEQENYRYVDFTWRNTDHDHGAEPSESMYSDFRSTDDEDSQQHNTNVLDESVDLSNNKATNPRPTRSGGRRRRKRVQTPVQRSAANMRERRRMCHLNVAFDYLKEHLPNVKDKKKLSRIQTLKAAIYYIHLLQDSLNVH